MKLAEHPKHALKQFDFADQDFRRLQKQVHEHTGIFLSDSKKDLVYGRLVRRLRALGLNSFRDYSELIDHGHEEELENLANAMSTNLTAFCRESHHFEYLADKVIPLLLENHRTTRRIRIWSAGCSTGEEAYNLAMVLRESISHIDRWDVRILATDIDSEVLRTAEQGVYPSERVSSLPQDRLDRWFLKGLGSQGGSVRVKPELRNLITFRRLNLLHPWPMKGPFDVIFCRNVVIYFDRPTQQELFKRFADILNPQSHLFIGHSESLQKISDRFELIGKTIYRKRQ